MLELVDTFKRVQKFVERSDSRPFALGMLLACKDYAYPQYQLMKPVTWENIPHSAEQDVLYQTHMLLFDMEWEMESGGSHPDFKYMITRCDSSVKYIVRMLDECMILSEDSAERSRRLAILAHWYDVVKTHIGDLSQLQIERAA